MKKDNVTFEIDGVLVILVLFTIIFITGIITSYYKDKNYQIARCISWGKSVETCKELFK